MFQTIYYNRIQNNPEYHRGWYYKLSELITIKIATLSVLGCIIYSLGV